MFPVAIVKCRRADASGRESLPGNLFHRWMRGEWEHGNCVCAEVGESSITEVLKIIKSGVVVEKVRMVWLFDVVVEIGG